MKHTRFALAVFALAFVLTSCAERSQMPAKGFEGTITESIQMPGIGDLMRGDSNRDNGAGLNLGAFANMQLKMYVRENKIAYDISMLGGLLTLHSIIDRDARTMTTLMPDHTARIIDLRAMDSMRGKMDDSIRAHTNMLDTLAAMIPQPTGNKKTIHDMEAEEYKATKGPLETTMWLSQNDKVKAFDVVRDAVLGRGSAGGGGLDEVFAMMRPVAGKIPVKTEVKMNGKLFAKAEMTDITEEKVDDAIFEIPKDYTIVKDSAMPKKQKHVTAP